MKSPRRTGKVAKKEEGSNGSRSVRRSLDIFELMLQCGEPITMTQIIMELAIPKSTAYELVRTLAEGNYITPSGKGSALFLGRRLFEPCLPVAALDGRTMRILHQPVAAALASDQGRIPHRPGWPHRCSRPAGTRRDAQRGYGDEIPYRIALLAVGTPAGDEFFVELDAKAGSYG